MATRQMLIGTVFDAEGGFANDIKSIDFDGVSEKLMNTTSQAYGIADVWTVMCWFKSNSADAGTARLFWDISQTTSNDSNRINFQINASNRFRVSIADTTGGFYLAGDYNSIFTPADAWVQVILTYDGSLSGTARVVTYFDASEEAGSFDFNSAGNQADGVRVLQFGESSAVPWQGRMHSCAIWNEALDQADATAIFNAGDGDSFDLEADSGGYDKSTNLKHWWRLGTPGDIGVDVVGGSAFDATANAVGITEGDDVVDDSPGNPA